MLAMRTRPGALAAVIGVLLVRFLVAPEEQLPLRQDSMRFPLRIVAGVALVGVGIEAQGGDGGMFVIFFLDIYEWRISSTNTSHICN